MIRPATPADAEVLCSLLEQLGYAPTPAAIAESLNDQGSGGTAVFVYGRAEPVVGLVAVIPIFYFPTQQTLLRITALCVDGQYRHQGIGSALLSHVETLAASQGYGGVEVTCSLQRQAAHQFYQTHGYSRQGYRFVKPR